MVRPALLVEQQIPIDESGSACVQAAYDGMRILLGLAFLRDLALLAACVFHAAFGEQQLLVGPASRHFVHLLEMIARIPMKRHARKSIGGDRALGSPASGGKRKLPRLIHRRPEGGLNARQYLVGVVVPSEQLHIAMPRCIQRRTQIRCRELSFLFRAKQARIHAWLAMGSFCTLMRLMRTPSRRYASTYFASTSAHTSYCERRSLPPRSCGGWSS